MSRHRLPPVPSMSPRDAVVRPWVAALAAVLAFNALEAGLLALIARARARGGVTSPPE